jgi:hypothetical protein
MKSLYLEDLDLSTKLKNNVGMRNFKTYDMAKALKMDGYHKWKKFNKDASCTIQMEH